VLDKKVTNGFSVAFVSPNSPAEAAGFKEGDKIKVVVDNDHLGPALEAIIKTARTGKIGDGKIFVSTLDDVIRIRTGEKGKDAI